MTTIATDVHFRVTSAFNGQLSERAAAWRVSRHETARRLAVLANYNLTVDDHDRVVELAATMGANFVQAASAIAALDRKEG